MSHPHLCAMSKQVRLLLNAGADAASRTTLDATGKQGSVIPLDLAKDPEIHEMLLHATAARASSTPSKDEV